MTFIPNEAFEQQPLSWPMSLVNTDYVYTLALDSVKKNSDYGVHPETMPFNLYKTGMELF